MLRAVRLAATLGFEIEPATLAAIRRRARRSSGHLSGERIAAELDRLLAAPSGRRSGCGSWPTPACSRRSPPELAAQRGMPQNKIPGEDLWDHTLRTVDAAPPSRPDRPAGGAAPRHRQARDHRRRPVPRPRDRRRRAGRGAPRPAALAASATERVVHLVRQPHVRLRAALERRGGPAVHRQGRVATRSTSCSLLREADNVGQRRCRATPTGWASCGRGSTASSRPRRCSTGSAWRSTATT